MLMLRNCPKTVKLCMSTTGKYFLKHIKLSFNALKTIMLTPGMFIINKFDPQHQFLNCSCGPVKNVFPNKLQKLIKITNIKIN